jgi:hypothetical protein
LNKYELRRRNYEMALKHPDSVADLSALFKVGYSTIMPPVPGWDDVRDTP